MAKVRLVDHGLMTLDYAKNIAKKAGLDLVCVNETCDPKVYKVMDQGKEKYNKEKKRRQCKSKSKDVKQIKIRPSIDEGDLNTKIKQMQKMLDKGHVVNLTIFFKGREHAFKDRGAELIQQVFSSLSEVKWKSPPKASDRIIQCVIEKE